MLEALRAAKESLRSSAAPPSLSPTHSRERPVFPQRKQTRIIGACLADALIVSKFQQTKNPASVVAGPAIKLPADKPPDANQLTVSPDPFIME